MSGKIISCIKISKSAHFHCPIKTKLYSRKSLQYNIMQLPRGTFRYIKKNTKLGSILEDLQLTKFTGICTISSVSVQGSIVFKSGKRILAEYRHICGDAAWDEFQKIYGDNVDASVSNLDDTQIELSLEFNKSCRTGKGGKSDQTLHPPTKIEPADVKKSPIVLPGDKMVTPIRNIQKPNIPEKPLLSGSVTFEALHIKETPKTQRSNISHGTVDPALTIKPQSSDISKELTEKKRVADEIRCEEDNDSKNFESDIEAIETMDVDIITSKIRGECKTIIKQLRLDHLTER